MPQFVVCVPTTGVSVSTAPCQDVGGEHFTAVMMEFPAPGQVEFDHGGQLFAFGFSAVITLWLAGLGVGAILSVIKR